MDSATEEIYFQKLQEFVQDDDKIVTVSSLATDLGISIRISRVLISKYVDDQRKLKPEELTVTYVLTGTLKDDKGKGVFMVKEEDLKEKRESFENAPYEIIYSVQKCKHVDFNVIALVDTIDSSKIRDKALEGSIVSKNCIKRVIKLKKLPTPPPATLRGKSAFFAPKAGKSEVTNKPAEKPSESPKSEAKNKPSGSIANMFKAAAVKSNQKDSVKSPTARAGKQNSGLAEFLSNGSLNSSKAHTNGDVKKENGVVKKESDSKIFGSQEIKKDDVVVMDVDLEDEEVKHIKEDKKKSVPKDKKDEKKKNKRLRDRSQDTPAKKRKRIIERNDSDSDDLFEKDEDNEHVEISDDEPERAPSPVVKKQLAPKNKRRKAVDKNYVDEEGFVVTKTEYIYETASEDENEEPKPPKEEKQEKPKPKAPEKKKVAKGQATLMNFFKKV